MSRRAAAAETSMIRGRGRLLCLTAVVTASLVATGASRALASFPPDDGSSGYPSTWAQLSYIGDSTWKISSRYMTGSPHYKLVTKVCLQSRIPGVDGTPRRSKWTTVNDGDGPGCKRNVAYNGASVYATRKVAVCSWMYRYSYRVVARGWIVTRGGAVSHRTRDISKVQTRVC